MNKTNKNQINKTKLTVNLITSSALLIALEIVLNRFVSINTSGLKIGFSFVPIVIAATLYGPVIAAAVYGLADFLGAILFPIGPYFPGFTLCAAIMGFIYGMFLYRRPESNAGTSLPTIGGYTLFKKEKDVKFITHILPPVLINNLIFGLLVNTIWVSILYGSKTYLGWFIYRLSEYLILIPTGLIIIPILIRLCREIRKIYAWFI